MAAIRVLQYLAGTIELGIIYSRPEGESKPTLRGFTDSDWAGGIHETPRDGHSTSGHCFILCNGPISWRTERQSIIALSSCEAEYVALTNAAREALWLRAFLRELGFTRQNATPIGVDNQSTITLAETEASKDRSKHMWLRLLFVRRLVDIEIIRVPWVAGVDNVADIFTKPLNGSRFVELRAQLMS
jgi:hypothetical protein